MNLPVLTDPEQILAQAAAAATAAAQILPKLEAEYEDMEAMLKKKREQIESVRALAERVKPTQNIAVVKVDAADPPRSAAADVDVALRVLGPIGVTEMVDAIHKNTGRAWAQSTVWNLLKKGKDSGKYKHTDNKWSMADGSDLA